VHADVIGAPTAFVSAVPGALSALRLDAARGRARLALADDRFPATWADSGHRPAHGTPGIVTVGDSNRPDPYAKKLWCGRGHQLAGPEDLIMAPDLRE
jgi:hypothetical protein